MAQEPGLSGIKRKFVPQLGVYFEPLNQGPEMRRNIAEAKRILRAAAKKRGLQLQPVPLPPEAGIFPIARIEGRYRVLVQWCSAPAYGPTRYFGRVDAQLVPPRRRGRQIAAYAVLGAF